MTDRDYGSGVNRFLDPSGRNYETVVFQGGKAPLEEELNLNQDLRSHNERDNLSKEIPSGFITGDFLDDEYRDFEFFNPGNLQPNQFKLVNRPVVNVNGWIFPLEFSDTTTAGENLIEVDAPPSNSGDQAVDFVYLEVWRGLLEESTSANKPASDQIYPNGNVLAPSGTWLNDEMLDPNFGSETTKRLQIQYAIRTERLDDMSNRRGYPDPLVEARGPTGTKQAESFSQVPEDPGMWRAGGPLGSGSEIAGTADGFVYSIPICLVFRRNSAGFDFLGNGNGAVLIGNTSNRPDGYFADQIVRDDVQDMRKAVSPDGFEYKEILDRNTSLLLDQNLRSWAMNSSHTNWESAGSNTGTKYLKADDIVPSTPTQDPPSGNTFRRTDGVCKVFSDRPQVEKHVVRYDPANHASNATDWQKGDTLPLDFEATSSLGEPIADEMPAGTTISDVHAVVLDEDGSNGGQIPVPIDSVTGLGSQHSGAGLAAELTIGTPPISNSTREIWVEWEVSYPNGAGMTSHITEELESKNFEVIVHDPTKFDSYIFPTGSDSFTNDAAGRQKIRQYLHVNFDSAHREMQFEYHVGEDITETLYTKDADTIVMPEYIHSVTSISPSPTSFSVSGREITVSPSYGDPSTEVTVEYKPLRPLPINGAVLTIYYRSAGLQAIPYEQLPSQLNVKPVEYSDNVFVGTASSGSSVTPFPYEAPLQQIPVIQDTSRPTVDYLGEGDLDNPADITIDDFQASTGFMKLPSLVPAAPVSSVRLEDPVNITSENEEYIDHYLTTNPNAYQPAVAAQGLSSTSRHKSFYPVLAVLDEDTDFARKGTMVMLIFSNYEKSPENKISFLETDHTTCVAVYKLKGNFVTHR